MAQENVKKKFKDVFKRSPAEGTSLEEKVNYIAKGTKALKTMKGKELENKMENTAKLNKELEKRQRQNDEEIDKLRRSTQELRKEFGISKRSRSGGNDKSLQEAKQGTRITEASTQTDMQPSRVEGLRDNPEFQEAANTLRETTTEGKSVEQNEQKKTSEASVQTDTQSSVNAELSKPKSQAVSPSVSESSADTLGKTMTEGKNVVQSEQKKTSEASVQTDTQPSKHDVSPSVSKSSTKEKSNNKKPEPDKKDDTPQPQENQKEEGLFSLLKRFVKKILEKLLDEDEKSVENARGMREGAQRNTSSNEGQQKSMDQSSFININGKNFNLEPEKTFNYQDKALNINISITHSNQLRPETEQHLQQGATSPDIVNAMNLNINGKEYNVQPGESFNYKSPGLEISVINGHQQSKNFDKILSQDHSISKGLEQATKLENPAVTPVNTPKVNAVNTGHGR